MLFRSGMIHLGSKPKDVVNVEFKIEDKSGGNSVFFPLDKQDFIVEPDIQVTVGSRLTISVEPSGPMPLTEVWVSFLWIPTVKDIEAKQFLMNELVKDDLSEE